jgi:NAD-dependent DNA ligase
LDLGSGSLGAKKVEQLVEEGVLRSAADLLDFVDEREASLSKLSALDGWGATSSEKVLDALETRAATPIPLAAFVFALGAPRIGKATAKRVANISGSWAALRKCLSPTTAADDALRTALVDARGVGPAAVEGLLEFFAGEADAAVADRLAARLDVVDDDT